MDPHFHRSYGQIWQPTERTPRLIEGYQWKHTDLPLMLIRAMDEGVLAASTLSKHLQRERYPEIASIYVHISRNDVTYIPSGHQSRALPLLQYTWDQHCQLVAPENFIELYDGQICEQSFENLQHDLTQASFGRFGLIARCLRLIGRQASTQLQQQAASSASA